MRSRSNPAMPAKMVMINLPAWVVVSAEGSEMDWNRAPAWLMASTISSKLRGPGQPVKLSDGDDLAVSELIDHSVQLWPFSVGSGDFFAKDLAASGLLSGFQLKNQSLICTGPHRPVEPVGHCSLLGRVLR